MNRLRVGVVGGSIAGTTAAVLLNRLGFDVTVLERTSGLEERGGGIAVPHQVIADLVSRDLVDGAFRGVEAPHRAWCTKDGEVVLGRTLAVQPLNTVALHWGLLYDQLRARLPEFAYQQGRDVVGVSAEGATSTVELAGGETATFDLVIGADGYRSRLRRQLFPEAETHYSGYPAWRGTIDESAIEDAEPVDSSMQTVGTPQGHAPFYLVPGKQGQVEKGKRRLNWLWYEGSGASDAVLERVDEDGRQSVRAIAPGELSGSQRDVLVRLAHEHLPPWHRNVVLDTPLPYLQPLVDLRLTSYVSGSVCVIGDAASVARPHTGSGTRKALEDAYALADALAGAPDLATGLAEFDTARCAAGTALVDLGAELGNEQVLSAPRWDAMDQAEFAAWFGRAAVSGAWYVGRRS